MLISVLDWHGDILSWAAFPELWKCAPISQKRRSVITRKLLFNIYSHSQVSFWKGTFTALFLTTCMCTIQFLTGNGASPVVSQPLLLYCPSPMTVYNPSIIKMRYAQSSSISARLLIWSHMLILLLKSISTLTL